jgi:hypothetical protein
MGQWMIYRSDLSWGIVLKISLKTEQIADIAVERGFIDRS